MAVISLIFKQIFPGTIQRQTQNPSRETATCLNPRKCSETKKRRRHPQSPPHHRQRDPTLPLRALCPWHFQRTGPIASVHLQKSHLRVERGKTRIYQISWPGPGCFCRGVASLQGVEFQRAVYEVTTRFWSQKFGC